MERLTKREVAKKDNYSQVEELLNSSFKTNDLYTVWVLSFLAKRKYVHFDAYYDEKDELIGTTYLIHFENFVFVQYICVREDKRLQGYGTEILTHIKETYPGAGVMLVMENPDFDPVRATRLEFFKKNGFRETNTLLLEKKAEYLALSTDPNFKPADLSRTLKKLAYGYYRPKIGPWHEE